MAETYRFGPFHLDAAAELLFRGTEPVSLGRRAVALLRVLAERPGVPVSKEVLIQAAWPGLAVEESNLTVQIAALRRALGEEPGGERWIETLPRRGYRFVGPVAHKEDRTRSILVQTDGPPALPDRPSIAVLPFTNLSGDPSEDYFSDGITEDIITELSRFSELFVIARNSSFQYKGKSTDIRQVGRELGVRYVLEGSIRRIGDRVRITGQLIDATTAAHRWAERYDRELKDVFAVQDEVARTIVSILAAHVNKAEVERTLLKPPATWQAYDYYIRAADIFVSFLSSLKVDELYEVRRLLERSTSIDPNYARAYAMISDAHVAGWVHPLDGDHLNPNALDRAYQFAREAVRLDPNLPQARVSLGLVSGYLDQHDGMMSEFEKAMVLNPNFTDWRFGRGLIVAGEFQRAIEFLKAHMQLDPFSPPIAHALLGLAYYMLKRYSEALGPLRESLLRSPHFRPGHVWLAATYAQKGEFQAARNEAAEVLRIQPGWTIDGFGRRLMNFKHSKDAEHFFDALRLAGLPK